jgi:hypothetical protein
MCGSSRRDNGTHYTLRRRRAAQSAAGFWSAAEEVANMAAVSYKALRVCIMAASVDQDWDLVSSGRN